MLTTTKPILLFLVIECDSNSLRMVLARAATHDLQIDQLDLEPSFIQPDIDALQQGIVT